MKNKIKPLIDRIYSITDDREVDVMADAGRHSDLTFVSSFVSELDVAVMCTRKSRSNI